MLARARVLSNVRFLAKAPARCSIYRTLIVVGWQLARLPLSVSLQYRPAVTSTGNFRALSLTLRKPPASSPANLLLLALRWPAGSVTAPSNAFCRSDYRGFPSRLSGLEREPRRSMELGRRMHPKVSMDQSDEFSARADASRRVGSGPRG